MTLSKSILVLVLALAFKANSTDLIVYNAKITDFNGRQYSGFSVKNGVFKQLSKQDRDLLTTKTASTILIDAKGRRVIPGINDSHTHAVRGGRFYNLETRWEGVSSLKEAIKLIEKNAKVTPKGHWVRVIGGWSPYQFKEKRMPTSEELTNAAPDTPVFVLHLYSGGILNKKAMEVLGLNQNSVAPKGSYYEKDPHGNLTGLLVADPNPMILYRTISALPHMTQEQQLNSSILYYNKLLRFGMTSVIDAGGGGHVFPYQYRASLVLAASGKLPIRVANFLFPQKPGEELNDFMMWMSNYNRNQNSHIHLHNGYVIEGGGELLAWKASDYENFTADRPELHEKAEAELEQVVRLHLLRDWPFRLHATYDESITRILNVFEKINQTQPLNNVRWILDHAETISDNNLVRVRNLGGSIAVQGRVAFAGEDFLARYGEQQTNRTPPIKKMLEMGIHVGLGTDGTRVSSFNPWPTYYWAVSGRTVGGTQLMEQKNRLSRLKALELFTAGSAYISGEESVKGQIKPGMYADFAILDRDILTIDEKMLLKTRAVLTAVGGEIKFAQKQAYPEFFVELPKAIPSWSPVNQKK